MYSPRNWNQQNEPRMCSTPNWEKNIGNSSYSTNSSLNSSNGVYSPRNQFQGVQTSKYSSQGEYSQRKSTGSYSQRYPSQKHRNSPYNSSPGMYSPRHTSYFNRQANQNYLNNSSSNSRHSFNSSGSYTPNVFRDRNKRNHQNFNRSDNYDIRKYVSSSMLENPWAALEAKKSTSVEQQIN
ncbi:hypothetical protein CDAR_506871 [Caerostris darwini]|uniref:Uncharacterized protein n=1 Tax=Caerostris darwini TaxID=1538125 RepID=A0AAV4P107_9ARAC|nr:hypothetical protein CDAR_506871 [Caerostris darwini]